VSANQASSKDHQEQCEFVLLKLIPLLLTGLQQLSQWSETRRTLVVALHDMCTEFTEMKQVYMYIYIREKKRISAYMNGCFLCSLPLSIYLYLI
jgi:hypothetical protein